MGLGWYIIRSAEREQARKRSQRRAAQRYAVTNDHRIWPEQWKLARRMAVGICQRTPGSDFDATAELLFQQYVRQARGAQTQPAPAREAGNSKAGCGVLIFLAVVGTVIGLVVSNVKQGPTPITGPNSCVAKVTAGADTAYADGDGPGGAAGTGGVIPNPNIPAGYTFPTYVVINDPLSTSQADCDEDIAYEGMTKPSSDPITYLSALPTGLTKACTGSGSELGGSAWYGMADVTIYTDNSSDASYIGTSCGWEVNNNTKQLPYEQV